jgi:hypothetical protein
VQHVNGVVRRQDVEHDRHDIGGWPVTAPHHGLYLTCVVQTCVNIHHWTDL